MKITKLNIDKEESIIFLNPLASDVAFWKNNDLLNKYEIILIDYSGYNSEYKIIKSIDELAQLLKSTIFTKIEKPFHIIGYSYGGYLLQYLINIIEVVPKSYLESAILIFSAIGITLY